MYRGESSRENMQTTGRWSNYILCSRNSQIVYNKTNKSNNPVVEPSHESLYNVFFAAQTHVRAYELCLFWQAEKYKLFSAQKYSSPSIDRHLYKPSKHRLCTSSPHVFLRLLSIQNVASETQNIWRKVWI